MLQPTVRRPWAPQGQTPLHDSWDRHDRRAVTGAVTVSPVHKRPGFYFAMASAHITGNDVFAFVQQRRGHLKRPLLLIWARCSGPKTAARLLDHLYGPRLHVAFLPAYAPALNVVEQCWGHTKYGEMAHLIPHDVHDLAQEVAHALLAKHQRPDLLRAFFPHAQLRL